MSDEVYVVWSNEHASWWGPFHRGYSRRLDGAGHYTRNEALEICRQAVFTAAHIGMISEIPVRLQDIEDFMRGAHLLPREAIGGK